MFVATTVLLLLIIGYFALVSVAQGQRRSEDANADSGPPVKSNPHSELQASGSTHPQPTVSDPRESS